jgi:hypothetical protein
MALVDIVRGVEAAVLLQLHFGNRTWTTQPPYATRASLKRFLPLRTTGPVTRSVILRSPATDGRWMSMPVQTQTPSRLTVYRGTPSNPKLPQPLLSLQRDQLRYSAFEPVENVTKHFFAVSAWIMLRSIFADSMWDGEITCPVLEGPYAAFMRLTELHPYCPTAIASGGCGRVAHGANLSAPPRLPLPACPNRPRSLRAVRNGDPDVSHNGRSR